MSFICQENFKYHTDSGEWKVLKLGAQELIKGVKLVWSDSDNEADIKKIAMKVAG